MLRLLTSAPPTGPLHFGHYRGAVAPFVNELPAADEAYFTIADLHMLAPRADRTVTAHVPDRCRTLVAECVASGAEPDRCFFYRQSDVPEIFELSWILSCFTSKGLMNRAHAYKAAVDKNREGGVEDLDAGVSMGLFGYPVLMAADILLFRTNIVPVGKDQVQHVEIARDVAQRFNTIYGPVLTLPEARISKDTAVVPGLDGRKMSKSYGNGIPLFAPAAEMRKRIFSIVTDSRVPGEPKPIEGSAVLRLYEAFATAEESARMRAAFAAGIAWGEAKQTLFERIEATVAPMRSRYQSLMADAPRIEQLLQHGAAKARAIATPFLAELRRAVGLRKLF